MSETVNFKELMTFFQDNSFSIIVTVGLFVLFGIVRSIVFKLIRNHAKKNEVPDARRAYILKLAQLLIILFFLTIIGAAWEISLKGLSVYFSSIFAVVGVALFATWSVLSNLTSSIVIYFFFPYRIGDKVRVVDGDNSITGEIEDIALFYVRIKTEDGRICSYPNNLAIQKPFLVG